MDIRTFWAYPEDYALAKKRRSSPTAVHLPTRKLFTYCSFTLVGSAPTRRITAGYIKVGDFPLKEVVIIKCVGGEATLVCLGGDEAITQLFLIDALKIIKENNIQVEPYIAIATKLLGHPGLNSPAL